MPAKPEQYDLYSNTLDLLFNNPQAANDKILQNVESTGDYLESSYDLDDEPFDISTFIKESSAEASRISTSSADETMYGYQPPSWMPDWIKAGYQNSITGLTERVKNGQSIKEYDLNQEVEDMAYEELRESRKALNTVKSELNEVNLLNSKLLYVNRIFKANDLSEGQKLRVVETLDKASSVKESKLIYETIKDSFSISKTRKTKQTPKKRSIRENLGMASSAAGISTAPKKPILNESNDMVTRMQKLANIKINQ